MAEDIKNAFVQAAQAAKVDAPVEQVETQQEPVEQPNQEEQQPITQQPQLPVNEQGEGQEEEPEVNVIQIFKERLGYTGDIDGNDLETFIKIAESVKGTAVEVDPRYTAFIQHLENGGNEETFAQMQPRTVFQDLVIDEGDVETQEEIVRIALTKLNGLSVEDADSFITTLKDGHQLITFANNNLATLAAREKADNEERVKLVEDQLKQDRIDTQKYYDGINEIFKQRKLIGITNLEHLNTVQQMSVLNDKGELPIEASLDKVRNSAELTATANYMIWCLTEGKPFNFNPNTVRGNSNPNMNQVFNTKNQNQSQQGGTPQDLESLLKKHSNR